MYCNDWATIKHGWTTGFGFNSPPTKLCGAAGFVQTSGIDDGRRNSKLNGKGNGEEQWKAGSLATFSYQFRISIDRRDWTCRFNDHDVVQRKG